MVKFGKNKFKALNKLAKKQSDIAHTISNKVIKKKINADKKVSFQKEVLLKESTSSSLVKNVSSREIIINDMIQNSGKKKAKPKDEVAILKQKKSVENKKKRQKIQINDTKLLLNMMKKKK